MHKRDTRVMYDKFIHWYNLVRNKLRKQSLQRLKMKNILQVTFSEWKKMSLKREKLKIQEKCLIGNKNYFLKTMSMKIWSIMLSRQNMIVETILKNRIYTETSK